MGETTYGLACTVGLRDLKAAKSWQPLTQFLVSNPATAEKSDGDAMAASLSGVFPCEGQKAGTKLGNEWR
jgi:hypothetical protein